MIYLCMYINSYHKKLNKISSHISVYFVDVKPLIYSFYLFSFFVLIAPCDDEIVPGLEYI